MPKRFDIMLLSINLSYLENVIWKKKKFYIDNRTMKVRRGSMKIYAISDIHGCLQELEEALSFIDISKEDTKLIFLGDYIHGPNSYGVLDRIIKLQEKYGTEKVIALMGNHENDVIEGRDCIDSKYHEEDIEYIRWMKKLPLYYATKEQIFCHAGIEEEAEDLWKLGTEDYTFIEKFPASLGAFYMDIIAGHVGTYQIAGDREFHDIYYDGYSHYYIDGTVLHSGKLPVLLVDTKTRTYYSVTKDGKKKIVPYEKK